MEQTPLQDTDAGPKRLSEILESDRLVEDLDPSTVSRIGRDVLQRFQEDMESRAGWEARNLEGMKLAMQITEPKTFPNPGASNIRFPILTIAAIQYHAIAYPLLVPGDQVVSYRVWGPDPEGLRVAIGRKLAEHMSWQLLEDMPEWEREMDDLLMMQPILGTVFKKTFFDPIEGKNRSELVSPFDLVVPYQARDLSRCTQIMVRDVRYVQERLRKGLYYLDGDASTLIDRGGEAIGSEYFRRVLRPADGGAVSTRTDVVLLEHYGDFDLDGDDFPEPYVVTVAWPSARVLRIVPRFTRFDVHRDESTNSIYRIEPFPTFTKFGFIPSPDGSYYDIGLGVLLSPMSHAIDTAINQIIDAQTRNNLGGGFIAKGAGGRGGPMLFKWGEWKPLDVMGDDLRKSLLPLPNIELAPATLALLQLLIQYSQLIVGATEGMLGTLPGQNTPAETSRTALAQSMKVFGAIFKRTYNSLRHEFQILYRLNSIFLPESPDNPIGVTRQLYMLDPRGVRPVADPDISSPEMRFTRAQFLAMRAQTSGLPYDRIAVETELLSSMHIKDAGTFLKPGQVAPPPNPKAIDAQIKMAALQQKDKQFQATMQLKVMDALQKAQLAAAQIDALEAKAQSLRGKSETELVGQELALVNSQIALAKAAHHSSLESINTLLEILRESRKHHDRRVGGVGGDAADASDGEADSVGAPALGRGGAARGTGGGPSDAADAVGGTGADSSNAGEPE